VGGGGGDSLSAQALVLCYHGLGPSRSTLETSPEALEEHLHYLDRRGYAGVTFAAAAQAGGGRRPAAVTFDDAHVSVLELAQPLLERHGFPGSVFVPVGTVGIPGVLDWDGLAQLREHGWEIGSHGVHHRDLTELADEELAAELGGSRVELEERLGVRCRSIAYPYGRADARVLRAAAAAGFEFGCLLGQRGPGGQLALPRVGVSSRDTPLLFRLKVSRPVRALRGSRAAAPLEALGRAVQRG
jgi:peptidoglycan/xylan/chitin deacetylase (PgdA/CDA1 family)